MGHNGIRYTENGGDNNMVKMMVGGIRWVAGEGRKSDCSGTVWSSFSAPGPGVGRDQSDRHRRGQGRQGLLVGDRRPDRRRVHGLHQDARPQGPGQQQDHGRHDPHARRSRPLRGRRARHVAAARASIWPTPPSATCSCYYSPRNPDWPTTGAAQVVGYNQISRFTLTADGTAVIPGSERVILRVPEGQDLRRALRPPGRSDQQRPRSRRRCRPGLRLGRQPVPGRR